MSVPKPAPLRIAYPSADYDKVSLVEPSRQGYIHLAAEVDRRPPFLPPSRTKRNLIRDLRRLCAHLEARPEVDSAVVFRAVLIPPGRGALLKGRPDVRVARFDAAVLVETATVADAERLRADPAWAAVESRTREAAERVHVVTAENVRRIGPVDHDRGGVFLFNYFYADDVGQNLAVWEYTAGWFEQETGLDNSTLLLPTDGAATEYTVINHCRWDGLADIVPSLVLKRSFRTYVLGNFEANRTAAMPILYRRA